MKATKAAGQVSHARPFRWRRKRQQQQDELATMKTPTNEEHQHHHMHLTLRSSAIGHHHHHEHSQSSSLSYERNILSNHNIQVSGGSPAAPSSPLSTITLSQRYSKHNSTAPTPLLINGRRRKGTHSSRQTFVSLPMLMSLSILACVILSLLNLTTIDRTQPIMVVAIGTSGPAAVAASPSAAASQTPNQSTATLQQQQSNSVIQYPTAGSAAAVASAAATANAATANAAATTTINKAKYKTMYACEDRQLTIDCETGSKINLIRANFGRFSITQCNEQSTLDWSTDCMSPITFRIMQERCQDRQRCSVNATSALFGDRCPKTKKYLEVHFQCQMMEPDRVDVRERITSPVINQINQAQLPIHGPIISPPKPPNNPTSPKSRHEFSMNNNNYSPTFAEDTPAHSSSSSSSISTAPLDASNNNQLPTPVINSQLMTSAMAINSNQFDLTNKLQDLDGVREPIIVPLRHLQIENMARPRCYQWDSLLRQWTDRGAHILNTNETHTICAFDQQTSYILVMDYSGPIQPVSFSIAIVHSRSGARKCVCWFSVEFGGPRSQRHLLIQNNNTQYPAASLRRRRRRRRSLR
jgi:hypothetical protein